MRNAAEVLSAQGGAGSALCQWPGQCLGVGPLQAWGFCRELFSAAPSSATVPPSAPAHRRLAQLFGDLNTSETQDVFYLPSLRPPPKHHDAVYIATAAPVLLAEVLKHKFSASCVTTMLKNVLVTNPNQYQQVSQPAA